MKFDQKTFLNIIIKQYFLHTRCLFLISDNDSSIEIVDSIPRVNIKIYNTQFKETSKLMFSSFGCQDFIIKSKYPLDIFQYIEKEIKLYSERFNNRKYVFLQAETNNENIMDIFQTKEIEYVANLIIVSRLIEDLIQYNILINEICYIYNIWTHRYTGYSNNSAILSLDKWFSKNGTFLYGTNLFPDKLFDQYGRILRVAVFPYEPYVIIEETINKSYKYMGSEMMTLLTFSQYLNTTLVPVINDFDYWGDIWENWTGNGLLGNLVEDKADVGGAALYIWENMFTFLDMSKPTVRTGITTIVPAPRLAAGWLLPFYAYTATVWLVVIATILTNILVIFMFSILHMPEYNQSKPKLTKTKVFAKVLTCVAKPFIMQNIAEREMIKDKHSRSFMALVFISALVLSTTYDSGFATIMTVPRYENPINTVEEFVDSGLYWGATQDAWILSIKDTNETKYRILVERFVATSEERLRELSLTGQFGFSLERLPNDNYAVGTYLKPDIIQNYHLMAEDFYWTECVLMTRRNSILLPHLDDFVLRVFEAGLISFWQNEAASLYMDQTVQKAVKFYFHHREKAIIKLKMIHVQGALGILCVGCFLGLILFISEIIYYNFIRKHVPIM